MGRCQIDSYIQPAEIRDQLRRGSGHICKYKKYIALINNNAP